MEAVQAAKGNCKSFLGAALVVQVVLLSSPPYASCQESSGAGAGNDWMSPSHLLIASIIVITFIIMITCVALWSLFEIFKIWRVIDERSKRFPNSEPSAGTAQQRFVANPPMKGGESIRPIGLADAGGLRNKVDELDRKLEDLNSRFDHMGHNLSQVQNDIAASKKQTATQALPNAEKIREETDSPTPIFRRHFGVLDVSPDSYPVVDPIAQSRLSTPRAPFVILYASLPERDGTFKNLTEKQEWDSLYTLRLEGDASTATFARVDMCSNPEQFKTAIGAPALYLNPVCDYNANPPSTALEIVVTHSGSAERKSDGERWKIREKLRIDFR